MEAFSVLDIVEKLVVGIYFVILCPFGRSAFAISSVISTIGTDVRFARKESRVFTESRFVQKTVNTDWQNVFAVSQILSMLLRLFRANRSLLSSSE